MIKPLDQIKDSEIEEQIEVREREKTRAYSDYLYGGSNKWRRGWKKYVKLREEIEILEQRKL